MPLDVSWASKGLLRILSKKYDGTFYKYIYRLLAVLNEWSPAFVIRWFVMNEDNFLKKFRTVSTVFKEKQKGIIFLTKEYYLSYYLGNVTTCKKMNCFFSKFEQTYSYRPSVFQLLTLLGKCSHHIKTSQMISTKINWLMSIYRSIHQRCSIKKVLLKVL